MKQQKLNIGVIKLIEQYSNKYEYVPIPKERFKTIFTNFINELQLIPNTKSKWKQIAKELWNILDSIDTLPDMIHPSSLEGHEKCWKMMVKRAEERHKFLKSDGFNLAKQDQPVKEVDQDKIDAEHLVEVVRKRYRKQDKPECEHRWSTDDKFPIHCTKCWIEMDKSTQTTKHLDKGEEKQQIERPCKYCGKIMIMDFDSGVNTCNDCSKPKSKHLDTLVVPEKIEEMSIQREGLVCEQISNNDYFAEKINEIIDFNKQLLISLKEIQK